MRKVKFRGRDFAGLWHIGDLIHNDDDLLIRNGCLSTFIENETAGQFTGLMDKNGKEIYEGDIITFDNHLQGISQVVYDYAGFDVDSKNYRTALRPMMNNHIRVIGNIHDNPELLKGGAE